MAQRTASTALANSTRHITRGLHDASAMVGNLRMVSSRRYRLARCEGAFLVNTHQAAVAGRSAARMAASRLSTRAAAIGTVPPII